MYVALRCSTMRSISNCMNCSFVKAGLASLTSLVTVDAWDTDCDDLSGKFCKKFTMCWRIASFGSCCCDMSTSCVDCVSMLSDEDFCVVLPPKMTPFFGLTGVVSGVLKPVNEVLLTMLRLPNEMLSGCVSIIRSISLIVLFPSMILISDFLNGLGWALGISSKSSKSSAGLLNFKKSQKVSNWSIVLNIACLNVRSGKVNKLSLNRSKCASVNDLSNRILIMLCLNGLKTQETIIYQ